MTIFLGLVVALIVWTWGLTPLWVNIVASVLLFIGITTKLSIIFGQISHEKDIFN